MIRPLPPQNMRMFPYRASVERRGRPAAGARDASGGRVDEYSTVAVGLPCNVLGASVDTVPDLQVLGSSVNTVAVFPDDVRLREGDVLRVTDEDGVALPKPLTVKRYQRLGLWSLRRWQADCLAT